MMETQGVQQFVLYGAEFEATLIQLSYLQLDSLFSPSITHFGAATRCGHCDQNIVQSILRSWQESYAGDEFNESHSQLNMCSMWSI